MKNKCLVFLGILLFTAGALLASSYYPGETELSSDTIEKKIHKAVLSSPRYGVFDAVFFDLDNSEVILTGFVVMPITKEDIGRRVSKIKGVENVTNNIEVLPLSRMDASIRRIVYHQLFGTAGLYRYALGPFPSIHIIVKGGQVTLEGYVSSESDKKLALLASRGIPGVFSIENKLVVSD